MTDKRLSIPCPTCGARAGESCTLRDGTYLTVNPHVSRSKAIDATFARLPLTPTCGMLYFLAGEPLIMSTDDKAKARAFYTQIIERGSQ